MPMKEPFGDLAGRSLAEIAQAVADQRLPPVDSWNPPHCGDSAMRIAADGTWFHQGSPIGRKPMVRLFASLLRRDEDGGYVLVTPVEKLSITVEDAPFVAVEVKAAGQGDARTLTFRLNTDDLVIAGPEHPIRFEPRASGPHPYLLVRRGLEALIARSVYYELAELAIADGGDPPAIWSEGAFFPIGAQ